MPSKKDYESIAALIKEATSWGNNTVKNIAVGLADIFAADNTRFDRQKFLAACGLDYLEGERLDTQPIPDPRA